MEQDCQQLREEIKELRSKAELFPTYLSGLSHDIRTPLNSIIGFADLLKESNVSRSDQRLYSQMIVRSSRKLLSLMSDLIDLARIETGNLTLFSQKVYPTEILEELSEEFSEMQVLYGKTDIQRIFTLEEDVPDYFVSDRNRMLQIIRTLLDNSLKFTTQGKISLQVSRQSREIRFQVLDTGCGMSQETVDGLFDLFPAPTSPDAKLKSRGMSLLVVRKLVDMLNGTIHVVSRLEEGTAISLSFPL